MEFLPLFFQLNNRPCLLVGGGAIALRKANLLVAAGAQVSVVSLTIIDQLQALVLSSGGQYHCELYSADRLQAMELVVAATDDLDTNKQVSEDARARQLPVNVVDQPALCSFIFPAIIDRSPLVVAVSSGGHSPVLARLLRSKLESSIPAAYGQLANLLGEFRSAVKARFDNIDDRRSFWERLVEGPVAEMVFAGRRERAKALIIKELERQQGAGSGEVYLVGAGPGDPDLLTFKALRLMQKADVVLYDRLVAEPILNMVRRDAERINVGKARAEHRVPQPEINQLLVSLAKQGKKVVRLKGGDPFIFGRGGEEIELLAQQGIPFQVVPGVTAASGCAAYAGIPLTHRDYAQSVRFLTGHLKDGSCDLPWPELVATGQTLVFYMGLLGLELICGKLREYGRSDDTPIALVQQGTTINQRVLTGTLATLPGLVSQEKIVPPTLLIVGEVVSLRQQLSWFEVVAGGDNSE